MPTVDAETIERIAFHVLRAAGASDENARVVAQHLAGANLAGHDSHGFIRIPQYVREIREGRLNAKASPSIIKETDTILQVNGNRTFGQVVATFTTRRAIEKARKSAVVVATMCNMGHTGRIGTYPEMAAREGMSGIMFNGHIGGIFARVVPFGGAEGRFGTNPISMSFPTGLGAPVLLDFATSMAAEGKVRVYRNRGKELPDYWVINKNGVPSRNPNDLYDDGGLLPMGGMSNGHKGYALALMSGLFGNVLAGSACDREDPTGGATLIVIDLSQFAPIERLTQVTDEKLKYVKSSKPMQGFTEVIYPGEFEERNRQERLKNGILIEDTTWNQVLELIKEYGVEKEVAPLPE